MSFITNVFGANLVIIFGVFFYMWGFFAMFKNFNSEDYKEYIKTKKFFTNIEPEHIFSAIFWPIALIIIVLFKVGKLIIPMIFKATFKFFDKITPNIKISIEENNDDGDKE